MYEVLGQAVLCIACGILWRLIRPHGLSADITRQVITSLVYYLLLPALVLQVLWQAPLGGESLGVAFLAMCGAFAGMLAAWAWFRLRGGERPAVGALIIAAGFGNVTYLGLPILERVFGPWARSVAIQYDLFANTPLLLTVGVLLARAYGHGGPRQVQLAGELLRVVPLWAAAAAVLLNLTGISAPTWLEGWLAMLGAGVVPLMLFTLGLSLTWRAVGRAQLVSILPVLAIQLFLMPLVVLGLARAIGLGGETLAAVVLEAAMPCMVLGVVICDRYGLDTGLFATAVTASTALSLVTLPLWFVWAGL